MHTCTNTQSPKPPCTRLHSPASATQICINLHSPKQTCTHPHAPASIKTNLAALICTDLNLPAPITPYTPHALAVTSLHPLSFVTCLHLPWVTRITLNATTRTYTYLHITSPPFFHPPGSIHAACLCQCPVGEWSLIMSFTTDHLIAYTPK